MSREAMRQALEALEKGETKLRWAAISALKQALAEPEHDTDCHLQGICQRSGYSITTPRRPLTDEQIRQEQPVCADFVSFRAGIRCMERIHKTGKQV